MKIVEPEANNCSPVPLAPGVPFCPGIPGCDGQMIGPPGQKLTLPSLFTWLGSKPGDQ